MSLKRANNEEGGVDTENGIYVEMFGVMEVRIVEEDGTISVRRHQRVGGLSKLMSTGYDLWD